MSNEGGKVMGFSQLVFAPLSYTGWGALTQLVAEVEKYDAQKVLVVTDPVLEKIGITKQVTAPLIEKGFAVSVYTEVVPEPPLEVGEALVDFTRKGNFDLVIGFGGGSAMDLAKLAAVLAVHEGPVADYLNLTGTKKLRRKGSRKYLFLQLRGRALK